MTFIDSDTAFEKALESGRLSLIIDSHNYVGNYMYMGTNDQDIDTFKHVDTKQYISKTTKTVSIVTKSDDYNVYCNENLYTVHGRYKLFIL